MKFGISQSFACSYLSDEQETLLVYAEETGHSTHYEMLMAAGFRRSGAQVYRPHCAHCHACQAIRVPVNDFTPSKSQKRILKRNSDIKVVLSEENKPHYYALYAQYINTRHQDGSMYPATPEQYASFADGHWLNPLFIELHLDGELVGIAVTDPLENALSAVYTFFKPSLAERSLGTFAVLQQIAIARRLAKEHLYLGYQIDDCQKMSYKRNFLPHERFIEQKWQLISKKDW
jgi:arginyl-tRNA--protein-N-Asp/Glu arginylyltransferase